MAFSYLPHDVSKPRSIRLNNIINNMVESIYGTNGLNNEIANMQLMIDGDGSQDAHYHEITVQYGYTSDAVARSAWGELLSVQGKVNVDTDVTNVKAAILQAFNKFR